MRAMPCMERNMDHPRASSRSPPSPADDDNDQEEWELISQQSSSDDFTDCSLSTSLPAQNLEIAPTSNNSAQTIINTVPSRHFVAVLSPPPPPPPLLPPDPTIMPGWKDEYLLSLLEAERSNPVNFELVEACSHLNNKIAALEAEKAQWQHSTKPTPSKNTATDDLSTISSSSIDPTALLRLKTDLATTLRQQSSLESRLRKTTTELSTLRTQTNKQTRQLQQVTAERDSLRLKVRDQSEELRGKKQMLEQVQDEVLALDMQLNVAEQQKAKIAAENKQLIERWMRRAREEADSMNAANERGL